MTENSIEDILAQVPHEMQCNTQHLKSEFQYAFYSVSLRSQAHHLRLAEVEFTAFSEWFVLDAFS
jgi:hypothetical protein